uniref:Uncharacterized protein n=1 Tax=Rhizophora mucronata TaxID=61149 RepID=A0A2P2PU65_RHIMU
MTFVLQLPPFLAMVNSLINILDLRSHSELSPMLGTQVYIFLTLIS